MVVELGVASRTDIVNKTRRLIDDDRNNRLISIYADLVKGGKRGVAKEEEKKEKENRCIKVTYFGKMVLNFSKR